MSGHAGVGGVGLACRIMSTAAWRLKRSNLSHSGLVAMLSTDGNWSTTGIISFCPAGPEMCVIKAKAASGALVTFGMVRQPPHVLAADRALPLGNIWTSDLNWCC